MVGEIARQLVDHPDQVRVSVEPRGRGHLVSLEVAPEDMGQVIGRAGRVARALRTLVAAAARDGERLTLDIVD